MSDVLLFAGTTEGRKIAGACSGKNVSLIVSVATEYGETMIDPADNIRVLHGKRNTDEVVRLVEEQGVSILIDATHPYAKLASETILAAAERTGTEYIRVVREEDHGETDGCVFLDDTDAAVSFLNAHDGNALLTVGSKELQKYTAVRDYRDRLYARILPVKESADLAFSIGICGAHLICMQGPFSEQMNTALLNALPVQYLVTKDTGTAGGFPEKIRAAKACCVTPLVIRRPGPDAGISVEACLCLLSERFGFSVSGPKSVTIVGIGAGNEGTMTEDVRLACEHADLIIGAKRVTDALSVFRKPFVNAISPDGIECAVRNAEEARIVVAMSGDTGFFSGTKGLLERIGDLSPVILPGISSVQYLAAKLGVPWNGSALLSAHGRPLNVIAKVKRHARTFVLVGGENGVSELLYTLSENGFGGLSVSVGSNLSYEDESVLHGTAETLKDRPFQPLSVVCIENPDADTAVVTHGRDDGDFIRADVPMTKSEVRAVTLSRLKLSLGSICWDVGAGTGSVSIEMAECCEDGWVYAVERNGDACSLIEKNKRHFGVPNITVVRGEAPDALSDLPVPTHVFIGGSGGNLRDILAYALKRNPAVRIVLNTVTAETFADAVGACKTLPVKDPEITELFVSRAAKVGPYHMMRAQNPVYLISTEGRGADA